MNPTHKRVLFDEEVEARRVTAETAKEISEWCNGRLVEEINALNHESKTPGINVPTHEGPRRASVNDWVVVDDQGRFYITGSFAFNRNYEEL